MPNLRGIAHFVHVYSQGNGDRLSEDEEPNLELYRHEYSVIVFVGLDDRKSVHETIILSDDHVASKKDGDP